MTLVPEPSLDGMGLSINGESIPFTMQAEVEYMSIEEAYAAGLFEEIPDEPGMIRMPVVINVSIPYHILWPDEYPAIPAATADPDELQDNSDLERRRIALNGMFETPPYEKDEVNFRELLGVLHPGSLMAAKAAADTAATENSLQKAGAARSDGPQPDELQDRPDLERGRTGLNGMFGTLSPVAEADFRSLLGVLHPGSLVAAKAASKIAVAKDIVPASGITWSDGPQAVTGLRTPDGTPIVRAQYDEVKGPTSLPEASSDAANEARFDNAVIELKELEPIIRSYRFGKLVIGCRTMQPSGASSANWMRQQSAPRQDPFR